MIAPKHSPLPIHAAHFRAPLIVRHRSPASVMEAYCGHRSGVTLGGVDSRGNPVEIDMAEALRQQRVWGFAKTKGRPEIHWWAAKDATEEEVIALLAHELGHLRRLVKRANGAPREEVIADGYAAVALTAARIARRAHR